MFHSEKNPHFMIEQAVLRQPTALEHVTIAQWERLATELSSIIGERGFESLYARSLHQARQSFPWLTPHAPQSTGAGLALLKLNLQERGPKDAGAASAALLTIFIDTLVILIGEVLTTSILRKAWGDVADNAGTEHQ